MDIYILVVKIVFALIGVGSLLLAFVGLVVWFKASGEDSQLAFEIFVIGMLLAIFIALIN